MRFINNLFDEIDHSISEKEILERGGIMKIKSEYYKKVSFDDLLGMVGQPILAVHKYSLGPEWRVIRKIMQTPRQKLIILSDDTYGFDEKEFKCLFDAVYALNFDVVV